MWNPFRIAPKLQTFEVELPRARGTTASAHVPGWAFSTFDGDKFPGGFGTTLLPWVDYWKLRARSSQLYRDNGYARGIIRRLVTNVVNTGLNLEATPEEAILGFEEDALADWSEDVENRWRIWEQEPFLCDHQERSTFGELQTAAYAEALVAGDVLLVLRQDARTGLPRVQLISGSAVQTPFGVTPQRGNKIEHGVELDGQRRHVAYWIVQADRTSKRLPAFGEKTGRRIAWLMYGTDHRLMDVRGEPILSILLQSLKEIDRYRDAVQRKAVINGTLAMFIKKTEDKPGTMPIGRGAIRRDQITTTDTVDGKARAYNFAEHIPGSVLDELQVGEEPVGFASHGTDEKFGDFEEAIVAGFSWWLQIPPEILRLAFSSNYSASQAATNEFKMFLNAERTRLGAQLCTPVYQEWLRASALAQQIQAEGFIESLRDPSLYNTYGAWASCDWAGHIKPAVDLSKLAKGYDQMVTMGAVTRDRMARELTGTKFSKNVKKLARENQQLADANKPLVELERPPPAAPPAPEDSGDDEDERGDENAQRLRRIA